MLLLLLRNAREKVDTRMGIKISPRDAIYDIVEAVRIEEISRETANLLIMDVLMQIQPMAETEENS